LHGAAGRGYARAMGIRARITCAVVLAVAVIPTAAIATRPSVSPVYIVPDYQVFAPASNGAKPKLVARFDVAGNEEFLPSGGRTFAYMIEGLQLFTDCSPSRVNVPDEIGRFSVTRRKVSQRIHFKYHKHGVTIRGYFFGGLWEPRVRVTAKVTRSGCRDELSFTAVWHKPRQ
jgi:hypothetical protein